MEVGAMQLSLSLSLFLFLSQPRCCLAATSVGNLVLFGGGRKIDNQSNDNPSNVVDVFNVTSNTWTTATLSEARFALAATSVY
jgi:hypothetical protein